jgi:hypothetical protein
LTRRNLPALARLWRRITDPLPYVPPPPTTGDRVDIERWLLRYRERLAAQARRKGGA